MTAIAIIGLVLVGVTVAIFFLGTPVDFMALSFILIAEGIICGYLLLLTMQKIPSGTGIIRGGIISSLVIYWLVTAVLSVFRGAFVQSPGNFILVNGILVGVVAVVCVLLHTVAAHIQAANEKSATAEQDGKRGSY